MLQICFLFIAFDFEEAESLKPNSSLRSDAFLSIFCFALFVLYQNITDINISLTPQIGSHGHKKTPDCYTKGHSKVKNHVIFLCLLIETSAWKKHSWFLLDWFLCTFPLPQLNNIKMYRTLYHFSMRSVQSLVISASMKQIVPLIAVKMWCWNPPGFSEAVAIFMDSYWDTVRRSTLAEKS